MPTAIIEINKLQVYAYHGVSEQERQVGNDFEVSVRLEYSCDHAMITDRIDFTINYADVVNVVIEEMSHPSQLLENVTYRIYTELLRRFPRILGGVVVVTKLHPPLKYQMDSASFTYRW